jgi:hypothetical protein
MPQCCEGDFILQAAILHINTIAKLGQKMVLGFKSKSSCLQSNNIEASLDLHLISTIEGILISHETIKEMTIFVDFLRFYEIRKCVVHETLTSW